MLSKSWVFQKHQRTTNSFHQKTGKEPVARKVGLKKKGLRTKVLIMKTGF
jgi:hypothetical protein